MFPWYWIWTPHLNYPWSGGVAQRIEPNTNWFFDAIPDHAGNGRIEKKAFDVASYGRQLGLLIEVLIEVAEKQSSLSPESATSLSRLKDVNARIEEIKREQDIYTSEEIENKIIELKKNNPDKFRELQSRLLQILK